MELEIHPIQADILLVLLYKPRVRYSGLNTTGMSSDHFNFHVKRLVKTDLIKKDERGYYRLTARGKEFANRFDTDSVVLERQAKLGILVVCVKRVNKELKLLVQQRLKQPYYGFHGFVTGKIQWGEELEQAARRELREETGLSGDFKLIGVEHKMDYSWDDQLLEDKFFFVVKAEKIKGRLIEEYVGGKNMWLSEKEIMNLPDLFDDMLELIKVIKQDKLKVIETKYKVAKY
jgi:8-oxo-dGTP pyrophosphatase MutT (NUDIX family)